MKIITIGASAGGVESLKRLCRGLDPDIDATICIAMHLAPESGSMLPAILDRVTPLHVQHAQDDAPIQRGWIYVAPPNHHLIIRRGHLRLDTGPRENGFRPAVDPLFRSAASAYGPEVVGVILSGALDDGTAGLNDIKQAGGVAVVQDPADAFHPTMPQSALDHVAVDHCVRLDQMAQLLFRLSAAAAGPVPHRESAMTPGEQRKRSMLTCPECSGTLWELEDDDVLQFRCHVGHVYTEQAMFAQHTQTVERALWSAIRILEERSMLARRLAERARERQQLLAAKQFQERATDSERDADAIRQVLVGATIPAPVELERDRTATEVSE